ncbi:MAG: RloB family protein [Arcicella sp.]|nr:RloB family protein [Arcicella sp.]
MGKRRTYVKPTDKDTDWGKRQNAGRPERSIVVKETFLIYCEGENTEPEYFKSFPVRTDTRVEAIGLGMSRTALVKDVIKRKRKNDDKTLKIWVVFDRDIRYENQGQDNQDFNNAIYLASKNNINCAYSNDCFELWFLLRDEYLETEMHRTQIYRKLSDKLGFNYEKDGKGKDFAKSLYPMFLDRLPFAIRNAERLHKSHTDKEYCHQNPCTTVYLLVEELNKNLRK